MEVGDVTKWDEVDGDNTLRLQYDLNPGSIVWDVGAYHGHWANRIAGLYNCKVHCFEPITGNFRYGLQFYGRNKNLIWHKFGLSNFNGWVDIFEDKNCSSSNIEGGNRESVQMKDIVHHWCLDAKPEVDLIKINIEGDEYKLLMRLIDYGIIPKFKEIQVQFHNFEKESIDNYNWVTELLSRTHTQTWCYPWVWENWKLK